MQRIVREGQRFVRRVVTDEEARAELAAEPFKLELIGLKGGAGSGKERGRGRVRRGRRRRAHDLRQREPRRRGRLEGPLPRTAPAEHPHDRQRLGSHPRRRRVLAGEREEPAAAAHLRHRVAVEGRAARLPAAPRGGRQARPPPARARSSTCSRSPTRSARDCRSGTRAAASSARRWSSTRCAATRAAGYTYVYTPHITKQDLFLESNHLVTYKEGMFPPIHLDEERDENGEITKQGVDYYLKPMNCPMHILIYRSARAATATCRCGSPRTARCTATSSRARCTASPACAASRRTTRTSSSPPSSSRTRVAEVLEFVLSLLRDFGLSDFELELSMRDDEKAKWIGDDEHWDVVDRRPAPRRARRAV